MADTPTLLLAHALARHGETPCGILVAGGGFKDGESVRIPVGNAFVVTHDERNAPVPMGAGGERRDLLVSITDEGPVRMLAWARVPEGSDVMGLGIDLCSTDDFAQDETGDHFARLLFTDGEKGLLDRMEGPVPQRRAKAFATKEAAFKSTSAALRRWYEAHDEELFFEVRDFELCAGDVARGTARSGRAEVACRRMGIDRIEVSFADYEGMVLCVALALGRPERRICPTLGHLERRICPTLEER